MSTRFVLRSIPIVAALVLAGCTDATSPAARPPVAGPPELAAAAPAAGSGGIALDQQNGTMADQNTVVLLKGFNPTNPHRGDAIVATFFWLGSSNIITSVTDHLANGTPVGNTYTLVDYVTANGYSMAVYVATNVQNFPDAYGVPGGPQDSTLVVEADLSAPVTQGGEQIAAYTGVNPVTAWAIGAHQSASGSGSGILAEGPGSIPLGAGAVAHAVTLVNGLFGYDPPPGFSEIGEGDDPLMKQDGEYLVAGGVTSVAPQWTWYFDSAGPYTWLAAVLALNPPVHLVFTAEPQTTLPLVTMAPVKVTAEDAFGNVVTGFTDSVTIAIGQNGGLVAPGTLSGTKTVAAVNGVATFSDLSIDQPGNGYTLVATSPRATRGESTAFNIGAF